MTPSRIAIIGSGISGLGCAYILRNSYDVTLFEANPTLGGHTNTITTNTGLNVDTGFIVFNEKNYPNFCKLIDQLEVESIASNMSFGYFDQPQNYYYSSDFPAGLFSKKKNILSLSFYKFIFDIFRFNKIGRSELKKELIEKTIREYLDHYKFNSKFINEYVLPMGAAIWSTSHNDTEGFPAKSFLDFWNNHCLLQVFDRPKWHTIKNGSKSYIEAIIKKTNLKYFTNHPISKVTRHENGVVLYGPNGPSEYDAVIIATHADQALSMLDSPSNDEEELLGKWRYSMNPTVLHSDSCVMPPNKSAWSSWMYSRKNDNVMTSSYYMNRLQSLSGNRNYFVTLNPYQSINESTIIYKTNYEHPMMTKSSMGTQQDLSRLQGKQNTYYCGSYFGYGFHEDGFTSAINVGEYLNCQF